MDVTSRKRQFVINAVSGWAAQATFALVGFVLMPYAIWRLGEESYGIFLIARSAIIFLMFMQLGMGPSLTRFCSQAFARNDTKKIASISSTSQVVVAGLGLLASGCCFLSIPLFICFYEIPPELIWDTQVMLISMAISLLLTILSLVPQGILSGGSRYDLMNGTEIATHLLRLILVIIAFELINPSMALFGIVFLISTLIRLVILYWMSIKRVGRKNFFSFYNIDFSGNRNMLKFSFLPFMDTIALTVIFQGPVLIIGKFLGEEAVTLFAPAALVSQVLNTLLSQTSRPLTPLAGLDKEKNNSRNLGHWAIQFGQIAAILGFGVTLISCLFGPELLGLWLGPKFSGTWFLVTLMVAGTTMMQVQASTNSMALGVSNFRPIVFSDMVMAIVMMIGTASCLYYGGGLLSVAILFCVCSIARNVFFLPLCYAEDFQYSISSYIGKIYIKIPSFFTAVFCFGWMAKELGPDTLLAQMITLVGVTATLGITVWMALLPIAAKQYIRTALLAMNKKLPS